MPEELRDYIKSLPEYDEEIFKKITEEVIGNIHDNPELKGAEDD